MRAVMILVVVIAGCAADVDAPALEPHCVEESAGPRCEGGVVVCEDPAEPSAWCFNTLSGQTGLAPPGATAGCGGLVPTCAAGRVLRCVPCSDVAADELPECESSRPDVFGDCS